ncbi:MAG: SPOR domain-containing protein [Gammaproteobacteria bacterium]|nr:SPOR domain-containing protein [Gammaproteobacteria bacterium]MBU1624688.1 SPOR domain-containing protein [Gammaproteobacteria bacterium]MBU1982532.1 SPOR domain-containing protein [Gammaproteobacteria bacterium]
MASAGGSQKSKALASLIIGMVIGVSIAGIVAWYLVKKNPTTFNQPSVAREMPKPVPQIVVPQPPSSEPATPAQPQFEFYKVLPDKSEGASASTKPAAVAKPQPKPPVDSTPYLVQAGSFQNVDDAEKLKARLALGGFEASIVSVNLPEKGLWHRVRLGPFAGLAAANTAIASLKTSGITATAVRAQ